MAQAPGPRPVTMHPHWGHEGVLRALARAQRRGSLPSALLIHGARGVGKQHLALWLGRLLLCSTPLQEGPCGECPHCALSIKLEHPDLHYYFPLPRPREASGPEKLARALEEARGAALAERRENPLRPSVVDEPRGLYLAAAQTLRREAQRRPVLGPRKVFVIAEAETLAPQEASPEAANALLKLLEEPPESTYLLLTSGEPGRLLPTIRSRTPQLHLPPLSTREVVDFLARVKGTDPETAARAGALSGGSIGRALGFLPEEGGPGPLERTRSEALELLRAAMDPSPAEAFRLSATLPSFGARGLLEMFDYLEEWLRELAWFASGAPPGSIDPQAGELFKGLVGGGRLHPAGVARSLAGVERARVLAGGNVNPQLVVFGLLRELREEILGSPPSLTGSPGDG